MCKAARRTTRNAISAAHPEGGDLVSIKDQSIFRDHPSALWMISERDLSRRTTSVLRLSLALLMKYHWRMSSDKIIRKLISIFLIPLAILLNYRREGRNSPIRSGCRSDLAVPAFTRDDEAVNASFETHLAQRCTRGDSRGFCKTAAQQRGTYIWASAHTYTQLRWLRRRANQALLCWFSSQI